MWPHGDARTKQRSRFHFNKCCSVYVPRSFFISSVDRVSLVRSLVSIFFPLSQNSESSAGRHHLVSRRPRPSQ